jgi:hypothetical protein
VTDYSAEIEQMLDDAFAPLEQMLAGAPQAQPQEEPAQEPEQPEVAWPESLPRPGAGLISYALDAYSRGDITESEMESLYDMSREAIDAASRPGRPFAAIQAEEQRAAEEAARNSLSAEQRDAILSANGSLASLRGF